MTCPVRGGTGGSQCSASVSPHPPPQTCCTWPVAASVPLVCWGWEGGLVPNVFLHRLSSRCLRRPTDADSGSLNQRRSPGRPLGLPAATQARGVFTPRRRRERVADLASVSGAAAAGLGRGGDRARSRGVCPGWKALRLALRRAVLRRRGRVRGSSLPRRRTTGGENGSVPWKYPVLLPLLVTCGMGERGSEPGRRPGGRPAPAHQPGPLLAQGGDPRHPRVGLLSVPSTRSFRRKPLGWARGAASRVTG